MNEWLFCLFYIIKGNRKEGRVREKEGEKETENGKEKGKEGKRKRRKGSQQNTRKWFAPVILIQVDRQFHECFSREES